jgi:hypothetical protein
VPARASPSDSARFCAVSAAMHAPAMTNRMPTSSTVWGGTEDLDVEPVRRVPPVVERRGGEHRAGAPDAHPRGERAAEAPEAHGARALRRAAREGRLENERAVGQPRRGATDVDAQVRRRPERVAADRDVPRDVPDEPHDDARGGEHRGDERPRGGGGARHGAVAHRGGGRGGCRGRGEGAGNGASFHEGSRRGTRGNAPPPQRYPTTPDAPGPGTRAGAASEDAAPAHHPCAGRSGLDARLLARAGRPADRRR